MQNIPSHALDIRHMFRATPEYSELVTVDNVDDNINITLSYYDKVPTTEGQKEVRNLTEGNIVLFKEGALEVKASIVSIQKELGNAQITLKKEV